MPYPDDSPPGPIPRRTNRLATILAHATWYSFSGQKRLAEDVGVSRSTISRLVSGKAYPSLSMAQRITRALSNRLKRNLTVDDVFSEDGRWSEPSGCRLCGCRGCFPEDAYDKRGYLKLAFRNMRPGDWSLAPTQETPDRTNQSNR